MQGLQASSAKGSDDWQRLNQLYQHLVAASSRGTPDDWFCLGALLLDMRKWGAASVCFSRVVGDRGDAMAWANWGWCAHLLGESEVAEGRLRKAIELMPEAGHPHALLCVVLNSLDRPKEAVEAGRKGVTLEPGLPVNHVGFALALASNGEWEEMWREYEHRFAFKIPEFLTRPFRLWRGERVEHLLIECEQGLGDTLFALRWVPAAAKLVERVSLYVQTELYGLIVQLGGLPDNVTAYPIPRPLPTADAFCPLLSLPAAMGLGGPEKEGPYLTQPEPREPTDEVFRVGICWSGNPAHDNAHHRDCPLAYWFTLAEVSGVELHSLQMGSEQLVEMGGYGVIVDRAPEMTNFLDTADIIAGLDLVITVDTAVSHLAGAMGVPCWLLVNQRGRDFRWGGEGEDSAWYPSHRLWRRGIHEQWSDVMLRVKDELARRVGR